MLSSTDWRTGSAPNAAGRREPFRPTSIEKRLKRHRSMDQPTVYQICVEGLLDESWSDWLGGLTIVQQVSGETLLSGPVPDQAALHGILDKLYAMNLQLVSLSRLKGMPTPTEAQ
jgi:hypothetical protein